MFSRLVLCAVVLLVAACRYESTADLRSSAVKYVLTAAFPEGEHVFQTREQDHLLVLDVTPERVRAVHQNGGNAPMTTSLIGVLGSDLLPEKTYLAMAVGGTNKDKAQLYHYYPFQFGKTHVEWLKPAEATTVFSLSDLATHVVAAQRAGGGQKFHLVPPEQSGAVKARFDAWHQSRKQKSSNAGARSAVSAPPTVATQPTVKGFTVGDGVYVQGFLRDSTAVIREIDQANRRVKVQRYDDGVSEWVGFDQVISRGQSTTNDVARGAATIGLFVCMMSPETCKPQQK